MNKSSQHACTRWNSTRLHIPRPSAGDSASLTKQTQLPLSSARRSAGTGARHHASLTATRPLCPSAIVAAINPSTTENAGDNRWTTCTYLRILDRRLSTLSWLHHHYPTDVPKSSTACAMNGQLQPLTPIGGTGLTDTVDQIMECLTAHGCAAATGGIPRAIREYVNTCR